MSSSLPSNPSDAFKRRNPHLYPGGAAPANASAAPATPAEFAHPSFPLNTDHAKLNKTERAYLAFIQCLGFAWIGVQNVTLKLAHDCRYSPDFITIDPNGHIQAREVKGFFRDDAKVKLAVAARMFPWIEFLLVRKTKNGWQHTPVKP